MANPDRFMEIHDRLVQVPPDEMDRTDLLYLRVLLFEALKLSRETPPQPQRTTMTATATVPNPIRTDSLDTLEASIREEGRQTCIELAIQLAEGSDIDRSKITNACATAGWTIDQFTKQVRKLQERQQAVAALTQADELDSELAPLEKAAQEATDACNAELRQHRQRIAPLVEKQHAAVAARDAVKNQPTTLRANATRTLGETLAPDVRATFDRLSDQLCRARSEWQDLNGGRDQLASDTAATTGKVEELRATVAKLQADASAAPALANYSGQLIEAEEHLAKLGQKREHFEKLGDRVKELTLELHALESGPMRDWRKMRFDD